MVEAQVPRADAREIAPDLPSGLEPGLRNYWYPILRIEELPSERPVLGQRAVDLLDRRPVAIDSRRQPESGPPKDCAVLKGTATRL